MRIRKLIYGLLAVSTAGFIASCGDSGSTDELAQQAETASNEQTTKVLENTKVAKNIYETTSAPLENLSNNLNGVNFSILSTPSRIKLLGTEENCKGTASGDTTDADNDGIPKNATLDIVCTGTDYSYQGKISIKDNNDNDKTSGFKLCSGTFDSNDKCSLNPVTAQYQIQNTNYTFKEYMDIYMKKTNNQYSFERYYFKYESNDFYAELKGNNFTFKPDQDDTNFSKGTWNGKFSETMKISYTFNGQTYTDYQSSTIEFINIHTGTCQNGMPDSGTYKFTTPCPAGSTQQNLEATITFNQNCSATATATLCDGTTETINLTQ